MIWTAILFDGDVYSRKVFSGPPDRHDAMEEAKKRFSEFWALSTRVVMLIPGDHPVYPQ